VDANLGVTRIHLANTIPTSLVPLRHTQFSRWCGSHGALRVSSSLPGWFQWTVWIQRQCYSEDTSMSKIAQFASCATQENRRQ
jgi:hypothetical protein